jgi:hypothetical protein
VVTEGIIKGELGEGGAEIIAVRVVQAVVVVADVVE